MFLMLIIRPQIFECKHIPRSHTDTLWHQTNCHSIFEKSGGKKRQQWQPLIWELCRCPCDRQQQVVSCWLSIFWRTVRDTCFQGSGSPGLREQYLPLLAPSPLTGLVRGAHTQGIMAKLAVFPKHCSVFCLWSQTPKNGSSPICSQSLASWWLNAMWTLGSAWCIPLIHSLGCGCSFWFSLPRRLASLKFQQTSDWGIKSMGKCCLTFTMMFEGVQTWA